MTTLFSAAVASPATARMAYDSGLMIGLISNFQFIAGLYADTETLVVLRELGMPLSESLVNATALSGRLHMLQQLLSEQQCARPINLSHYAARSGSISMLNWLRTQKWCEFGDHTCNGAASAGHLAVLRHLRRGGCSWERKIITYAAASGGSTDVMKWLRQEGIQFDATTMTAAATAGQIAMCEYLRSVGCKWNADVCGRAAESGQLDALCWLREHGCPWNVCDVGMHVAHTGHTNILDYVIEQGEVLDVELLTDALNCAGAFGQLAAAQWFRQHGAQWPAVLRHTAHPGFSTEWTGAVLDWARAEGCTSPTTL
jgi:hypothetical protein